jgi:PHP family Zn ribbon phosphoesterase
MLPQDLHIHSTYSATDDYVVPQQTVSLIAAVKHARIVGVTDHFESLVKGTFEAYSAEVRGNGLPVFIGSGNLNSALHDTVVLSCSRTTRVPIRIAICDSEES